MPAKREIPLRRAPPIVLASLLIAVLTPLPPLAGQAMERRVIAVTLDGMRWQEVFGGADRSLIVGESGGVADTTYTLTRFWRGSPEERRRALFPFLWGTVATQGQILDDSARGSGSE